VAAGVVVDVRLLAAVEPLHELVGHLPDQRFDR
jgi:hypothetical protein